MTKKTVPYSLEAETAVLGSMLLDPDCIPSIEATLTKQHFYINKNGLIYDAICKLNQDTTPIDFLTVTHELETRGQLEATGGAVYISQLIESVPSAMNVHAYAQMVISTWRRRRLLDFNSDLARLAYDQEKSLDDAAELLQAQLNLLHNQRSNRSFQSFKALAEKLPPIQWLWPGWIPRGMITLLGAVPGAGKSYVALDLARRIIGGLSFPDGSRAENHLQNVIYVDAEMVPQLLRERAEIWKMDTSKLYTMLPNPNDMIDFSRIEYQDRLRHMIESLNPSLVIVDSLSSVSSKGENNIEDIRGIMGFFNEIACNYQVAIIIIHHLRKRGGMQMSIPKDLSIDDFRGSSHIIAMSRSVLGLSVVQVDAVPDRNGPRKLEVIKTNLAAYPKPVGCEFMPVHPTGVHIKWEAEAPVPYKEPTKGDLCSAWLADLLKDIGEPMNPKEIIALGRDEGFSRATIYRARKELPIDNTTGARDPNNSWVWAGSRL